MGIATVRIVGGHKRFDADSHALADIDLTIDDGDFRAILGRSGSGKSTLLRVIAGLETLTSGTVEWSSANGVARPPTTWTRTCCWRHRPVPFGAGGYPRLRS
ncbi:ATP-binding cassette domain-containing protein [Mycobacterium camsae]|uniref:ATP-binding cassette domain-containing protein n=1 Tax=Mycobacterium gordonae TaxID=1778 RepID=UPI00197E20C0